jgi:hypothetical protein
MGIYPAGAPPRPKNVRHEADAGKMANCIPPVSEKLAFKLSHGCIFATPVQSEVVL